MSTWADLKIRFQPKQSELDRIWEDPAYRRIGSGGARGGTKSGGGRRMMLRRRFSYSHTAGLILRRTLVELEKSHILKMFEEFPQLRSGYNDQKKKLIFPNGSVLFFGSAPHASDMNDYYSAEFADIMVDEAQEFTQGELEQLSGSNRCTTNSQITPKMLFTFMPGRSESGVPPRGLQYLKRVFVDCKYKPEELLNCGPDGRWAFVQAYSWDNIEWARKELTRDGVGKGEHQPGRRDCLCQECEFYSWTEAQRREYFILRTEYGANLASITDSYLRDAWLYGKWESFEGMYYPRFSEARHVISRAESRDRIKPWHTLWISGDWGYDHPTVIHLHAMDENQHVITFMEMWIREAGETELGQRISAMCAGRKFKTFPFSADAFGRVNKTTRRSVTDMIGAALAAGVPKPCPFDQSQGSRVSRARLFGQMMDSDLWQIVREDCPKTIECIPTLIRDPEKTEDVLKVDWSENGIGDDPYDSLTMGLQHMLGASIKPAHVVLAEKLQQVRQGFVREVKLHKPGEPDFFSQFGGKKC